MTEQKIDSAFFEIQDLVLCKQSYTGEAFYLSSVSLNTHFKSTSPPSFHQSIPLQSSSFSVR
jgi:hypothetical protein